MKNKKYIILFLIFICCSNNDGYINTICRDIDFSLYVVVPMKNEEGEKIYGYTTNTILYYGIYNEKYGEKYSFKEFLIKLLNGKIILYTKNLKHYWVCHQTNINEEYNQKGFRFIKNNYLFENKKNTFQTKSTLDENQMSSLIKIMFDHEYYIIFNDKEGKFSFRDKNFQDKK
ncbi:MAG: hypothetical protein LBQ60_01065 [Bacteroidales bacterium]|jgi:hypothetical protein|nr:hypothetical protein [Bacteroidales bacterium]